MVESLEPNVLKNPEERMNFPKLSRNKACQGGREFSGRAFK